MGPADNGGRQGLDRLAEATADLVLLDFMMPIIDGPGMFRAMQADPALREIPVVIMTSLDEARVRREFDDNIAYLRKPFAITGIPRLIAPLLAAKRYGIADPA